MSGKLILTIKTKTVNVRRGPSDGAGILARVSIGQQFDVLQILDTPGSKEQWARIEHPDFPQAYICTRMANGNMLAQVSMAPEQQPDEYLRGWNDCLDTVHAALVPLRK